jgi:hypothetical protein
MVDLRIAMAECGNNDQHLWLGEGLQQASITVKQHGELQQLGLRAATTLFPGSSRRWNRSDVATEDRVSSLTLPT